MSGILGHIQTSKVPIDLGRFQNMLDSMKLRGPDGEGIWCEKHIALGHRMLASTPESSGERLPFEDSESGCVITSDARLDNRQELIDILDRASFGMDVISDSALILKAYLKWGKDCVEHLLGDFAFAIWDSKQQTLFCGRDFMGVRPFNYCFKGGDFIFCSEPRGIAKYSGLTFTLNEPRIGDAFTTHLEGYDITSTFYSEVFSLPPAHILELKDECMRTYKYWQPEPETVPYRNDYECQEELTEILTKAVVDRLRGKDNPAILQSGGVDSAAIMGIARKQCQQVSNMVVHTYSGVSEDTIECKESNLISILSEMEAVVPHIYSPTDMGVYVDELYDRICKLHEPFDFGMVLHFLMYQRASVNGHRYILDGVDGDVTTGLSYRYPAQLFQQCAFKTAWRETCQQSSDFFEGLISPSRLLSRYMISAFTPRLLKDIRWRLTRSRAAKKAIDDLDVTRNFAKKVKLSERLIDFDLKERRGIRMFPGGDYLRRVQHPFLAVGVARYNRVASLFSLEPRHPLLDKRLVEFYMGLPWSQFMRNGWSKYLFRRVAEQYVPKKVCWRTGKEHVGYSFTKELLELKADKIIDRAISCKDLVNYMLREGALLCNPGNSYDDLLEKKKILNNRVAGVILWLGGN